MQRAKHGDQVTVHYIGTLDNGRIFDQRDDDQPLVFTIGSGEIFPALEQDIVGMKVGEVKNIHLPAEQAYGPRLKENLLQVSRQRFPAERDLRLGQKLLVELAGSEQQVMRIRNIYEQQVVLDGNHDLAGCDLTFALQLVKIG
jgi:FKBP-type peptidyl-prolyl cis-trans isomerase 2